MKRKICLWALVAIMMCGMLTGCGFYSYRTAEPSSILSSNTPSRGSFDYLYPEILMTPTQYNETTKEMESHSVTVYLPIQTDGYVDVYRREEAATERMGVRVEARFFDGVIHRINEDLSFGANLKALLEEQYVEYASEYMKDVEIAEPQETENRALATVSYLYQDYDGQYVPVDVTAVLIEMENRYVLVSIEVNYKELNGEYAKLISELERAYEIEIQLDEAAAKTKMNTADTEDETKDGTQDVPPTPFASSEPDLSREVEIIFNTPDGWTELFSGHYTYGEKAEAIAMIQTMEYDSDVANFEIAAENVKEVAAQDGMECSEIIEKPLGRTISTSAIQAGILMQAYYVDIGDPERCLAVVLSDATGGSYRETLDTFAESLLTTGKLASDEDNTV